MLLIVWLRMLVEGNPAVKIIKPYCTDITYFYDYVLMRKVYHWIWCIANSEIALFHVSISQFIHGEVNVQKRIVLK